jgi:hypothetical protein
LHRKIKQSNLSSQFKFRIAFTGYIKVPALANELENTRCLTLNVLSALIAPRFDIKLAGVILPPHDFRILDLGPCFSRRVANHETINFEQRISVSTTGVFSVGADQRQD